MTKTYGAKWRRWELHIHTPGTLKNDHFSGNTLADKWEQYYSTISTYIGDASNIEKNIAVIAVTDYLSINNYLKMKEDKRLPSTVQLLIPNVELRIAPVTAGTTPINIHCIFSPDIDGELESRFFSKLKFYYKNCNYSAAYHELVRLGKAYKNDNNISEQLARNIAAEQFVIAHTDLIKLFDNDPELRKNTIVVVSNSSTDGVSGIRTHKDFLIGKESQLDATRQAIYQFSDAIFSSNAGDRRYFSGQGADSVEQVISKCGSLKPCYHGSDAHSNDKVFQPDDNRFCWIKGDATFSGLKQTLTEPLDRVWIGDVPDVIKRVNTNKTKYISNLYINTIQGKKDSRQVWFDEIDIPLNNELVAIIGNKGSGKSALADIIALCADAEHSDDFTFLSKSKFKKKGFADRFDAKIKFVSNKITDERELNYSIDPNDEQLVQYLPQNYFDNVCNEIGKIEALRKEIEKVVFQYIPDQDKLHRKSFEDLISFKKASIENEIDSLSIKLNQVNGEIIKLEDKKNPEYIKSIESKLETKREELRVHLDTKPKEIVDPRKSNQTEAAIKRNAELVKWESEQKTVDEKIKDISEIIKTNRVDVQTLTQLKRDVENLQKQIAEFAQAKESIATRYSLDINTIITSKIDTVAIEEFISKKEKEINSLSQSLGDETIINKQEYNKLKWNEKVSFCKGKIDTIKKELGKEELEYQQYKENLDIWVKRKQQIEGNIDVIDTIKFYENELIYINSKLESELDKTKEERLNISLEIYEKKLEIKSFYDVIKENIANKLQEFDSTNITIDSLFSLKSTFQNEFMSYILKNKVGSFKGIDDGARILNEDLINYLDTNQKQSVKDFLQNVVIYFEQDMRIQNEPDKKNVFIGDQISNRLAFYNLLFSLNYIDLHYELRQNGKELDKLSPGEKGAMLLVFYLILDKSEIPLIIDQPEDNLDNQSVARVLVPYIRVAKKRRQIIMVTHNPNLAVVADAEQIICADIDKTKGNVFSFISGSIEDKQINTKVVDILEGTLPAFTMREHKYYK